MCYVDQADLDNSNKWTAAKWPSFRRLRRVLASARFGLSVFCVVLAQIRRPGWSCFGVSPGVLMAERIEKSSKLKRLALVQGNS
ncbi:hypothetical protein A1356_18075 [Methylomonas koyamae]|uniref:Uncharacterized protein n=1 Tax=Methylomonas koyamae TaxID=702114 RepID=A0AA91DA94_9GAMM|nr:hypothetical protein A1356_18075 [Methylomonas koyamae]